MSNVWPTLSETAPELRPSSLGSPLGEPVPLTPPPIPRKALAFAAFLVALKASWILYWAWREPGRLGEVLLLVAAVVGLELAWARRHFRTVRRGLLTLCEHGFAVGWPGREKAVPFGEIRALTLAERELYGSRFAGVVLRQVTVRAAGGVLRFGHEAFDGRPDPVTPALRDLILRFADHLEAKLEEGESLEGRGWSLTASGLTVKGASPVALADLTRASLLQGWVWVWKRGEERPFFRLPAGAPNALLLLELLARRLALAGWETAEAGRLGRYLFTLRTPGVPARLWRTEVHEDGIAQAGLRGRREMRFSEVTALRFVRTAAGSFLAVYEGPLLGSRRKARLRLRAAASQENFRLFLGRPAAELAERLARDLQTPDGVSWVRGLRIARDGVLYPHRGPGRKVSALELAPFANRPRFTLEKGSFRLYERGRRKPLAVIDASSWGFFPGLFLIDRLHRTRLLDGI